MDEVAFVESLFAPEMRSAVTSLFSSPPPSCGRVKALTAERSVCTPPGSAHAAVPPPPNSLLGGGIALSQLQTPFQPPSTELFVRLNEDDMVTQMLSDQDFADFHGFKKEAKPNALEPLELPTSLKETFFNDENFQPAINSRDGYTLPDPSMMPVFPLGGNGHVNYNGFSSFPQSPAWMQDDVSTPGGSNFQRVHTMKQMMAMSSAAMTSSMLQQPSPGAVDMFNPQAMTSSSQHPTPLWISTSPNVEESKRSCMKPLDAIKTSVERPPFSLTISPPASLIKELIVSADLDALTSRPKRPRPNRSDPNQSKAKAARTTSASPVSQENNSGRANGKVTKGKKCIEIGCTRRAQSNSRCKAHGGGARCQYNGPGGCTRSSQGGGFCRAHGGGKRCEFPGCTRGQQRKGRCYVHGGIRKCQYGSCEKKDRGNGFCISHGGGKRCEHPGCSRAVRRGMLCQLHEAQNGEEKEAGECVSL
uniref:Uncharacterized protein n=1 Tax=Phytophthora ramorum TaxID=164328 RepID=H3GIP0_PHYRM